MEIDITRPMRVNAKSLHLHLKVCDEFTCAIKDQQGGELKKYEGYVPSFMPGEHYGDYLILDIDIDTGTITNWPKPSPKFTKQVEDFITGTE